MSVHFNAANNAQLASPVSPGAVGTFTVAGRFNLDNVTAGHVALVWASGTGNALIQLFLDIGVPATPIWGAVMANDTNTQFSEAAGTTTIVASTWYHVCATYDGTTLRLYVNGIQEGTSTPSGVTPRAGNWAAFQFPPNMAGSLQDGYASTTALTAAQVLNLASYRFPADRTGIQYYIPNFTLPGTQNMSGVQGALTVSGGTQTAGPDPAVPWGPGRQPQAFRSAPNATATGSDVQTASMAAIADTLGFDVETASMGASGAALGQEVETASTAAIAVAVGFQVVTASMGAIASASGADVETGLMGATLGAIGKDVQTASFIGVAAWLGADVETAAFTPGGAPAMAKANQTHTFRRPPNVNNRRGLR